MWGTGVSGAAASSKSLTRTAAAASRVARPRSPGPPLPCSPVHTPRLTTNGNIVYKLPVNHRTTECAFVLNLILMSLILLILAWARHTLVQVYDVASARCKDCPPFQEAPFIGSTDLHACQCGLTCMAPARLAFG